MRFLLKISPCLCLFFFLGYPFQPVISQVYPDFVLLDENEIYNSLYSLGPFYQQLEKLKRGEVRTVNIVHVGDSHLQADFFSGTLRKALHKRFGAAGRGLVFPYRVAGTNSPEDIRSSSNASWDVKFNINNQRSIPIGICGITMRTRSPNFELKLSLKDNPEGIDYSFNKVTLFNEKGQENYELSLSEADRVVKLKKEPIVVTRDVHEMVPIFHTIRRGEILSRIARNYDCTVEELKRWNNIEEDMIYADTRIIVGYKNIGNNLANPDIKYQENTPEYLRVNNGLSPEPSSTSIVWLKKLVNTVYIRGEKTHNRQREAMLYGLSLENTNQSGILYHMIGVNGAKFEDYNESEYFYSQMRYLEPDLIIVSLGTNEAQNKYFNAGAFYNQVDLFVRKIRSEMPHAPILFSTPPASVKGGKYPNVVIPKVRDMILSYALSNGLACWNFFDLMGANDGIDQWYIHGLIQKDKLHLTRKGYNLQGRLLYDALLQGYGAYRESRTY